MKTLIFTMLLTLAVNANSASLYDTDTGAYLGELSDNPYDYNSTSNSYGPYGSKYSAQSINNPYGQYGSQYSDKSPNNPYSNNPPVIINVPRY